MKFRRHLFGFFLLVTPLFGQNTSGSANGPNAPFEGTIVPDSVQFAMSTLPQNELISARASQGFSFLLPNLEDRSYSDFPNEVVLTVYFTPW